MCEPRRKTWMYDTHHQNPRCAVWFIFAAFKIPGLIDIPTNRTPILDCCNINVPPLLSMLASLVSVLIGRGDIYDGGWC